MEALQSAAYHAALESNDPVFHSYLYDWFIDNGRTEELLQVRLFITVHSEYLKVVPDPNAVY